MQLTKTIDTTKFKLPVSTIKEVVNIQVDLLHKLKSSMEEQGMPLVTYGMLDYDFTSRNTQYKYYYDVPLKDTTNPAENLLLIIPKALIDTNQITGGEYITVIGYLKVNHFNNQFTVKFNVIGLDLDKDNLAISKSNKNLSDFLKKVTINRVPFPTCTQLKVAIVTPESGDAYSDFEKEISFSNLQIDKYSVNFLSKEKLVNKINLISSDKTYNVLILIRGGGSSTEFDIFDDLEICQLIAAIKIHKIIGLGHSSNRTLLELVVDNAFHTPTAAGRHVNTTIQRQIANFKQFNNNEISILNTQHNLECKKFETKIKFKQTIINILLSMTICLIIILCYLYTNHNQTKTQEDLQPNIPQQHIKKHKNSPSQ
jgi:exodeoxyribonuclease VII large subunit